MSFSQPRAHPSPVLLPEIISAIAVHLDIPDLAIAARINHDWSFICLPWLYRTIAINELGFKIDSLELGLEKHGHYCKKLILDRNANHLTLRIVSISRFMPNLVDLDSIWMDVGLLNSLVHLTNLERLVLSRLQGSYSVINNFFEYSFKGSEKIKELCINNSSIVTNEGLLGIVKTCPKVKVLDLVADNCLTEVGLIKWCDQLISTNEFTQLTSVNFANCYCIQSEGYQALFKQSRNLTHVGLMSTRVQDEALQELATHNRGLRAINLNCCSMILDQGLQAILRNCHQLESVQFLYCPRITAFVFFQKQWRCPKLEELRFSFNNWHEAIINQGLLSPVLGIKKIEPALLSQIQQLYNNHTGSQEAFYDPHLEHFIFGGPESAYSEATSQSLDDLARDTAGQSSLSGSSNHPIHTLSASITEYRQRLILAQIYRQLEQLTFLERLDIRDCFLPLTIATGFDRLGVLENLKHLGSFDKTASIEEDVLNWLIGSADEHGSLIQPLPNLRTISFKNNYKLSSEHTQKLEEHRPLIELERAYLNKT